MKLSEQLKLDHECGDFGNAIAGYHEQAAALELDAERYRWLRKQHWSGSAISVVSNPKQNTQLGAYCPSEDLLDAVIDALMLVTPNVKSAADLTRCNASRMLYKTTAFVLISCTSTT